MDFSRVKTVVHPDYAYLEDFVRRLPQEDFPVDRVFCDRRNTVVATHEQGIPILRCSSLGHKTCLEVFPVLSQFTLPKRTHKIQIQISFRAIALTFSEEAAFKHEMSLK